MERRGAETAISRGCLILTTSDRVGAELLETAITRAASEHARLNILIPAVLPPTLPISALPPRLAARLDALRAAAAMTCDRIGAPARIEVVQCRDIPTLLKRCVARRRPAEIVLVGSAGWALRRAAHGPVPVTVLSERQSAIRAALARTGRRQPFAISRRTGSANTSIPKEGN
jgi:hypothetical protein